MDESTVAFFKKVVLDYNRGDVDELLAKCKYAGPLLQVVANGIDLVGGMCYGFSARNDRIRSVKFMQEHMMIDANLAQAFYACVRNGVTHEGIPKIGFRYFLPSRPLDDHQVFTRAPNNWLLLNVRELANSYLRAIKVIAENPERHIQHKPHLDPNSGENRIFDKALRCVPAASDDVLPMLGLASYSANTPDGDATWFDVQGAVEPDQHGPWK